MLKKNLRNYTIDERVNSRDHNFSILVHKVDGRLLLTGPSGIYQDLIKKKLQRYQGRMILILISDPDEEETLSQTEDLNVSVFKDGESYFAESEELLP